MNQCCICAASTPNPPPPPHAGLGLISPKSLRLKNKLISPGTALLPAAGGVGWGLGGVTLGSGGAALAFWGSVGIWGLQQDWGLNEDSMGPQWDSPLHLCPMAPHPGVLSPPPPPPTPVPMGGALCVPPPTYGCTQKPIICTQMSTASTHLRWS